MLGGWRELPGTSGCAGVGPAHSSATWQVSCAALCTAACAGLRGRTVFVFGLRIRSTVRSRGLGGLVMVRVHACERCVPA